MRYLSDASNVGYKILADMHAQTLAETVRARALGLKVRVRTPKKPERVPDKGHLVNWILARYFAMPVEERNRFLREGKEETDRHLAEDDMAPFGADWPFISGSATDLDKPSGAIGRSRRQSAKDAESQRKRREA